MQFLERDICFKKIQSNQKNPGLQVKGIKGGRKGGKEKKLKKNKGITEDNDLFTFPELLLRNLWIFLHLERPPLQLSALHSPYIVSQSLISVLCEM